MSFDKVPKLGLFVIKMGFKKALNNMETCLLNMMKMALNSLKQHGNSFVKY